MTNTAGSVLASKLAASHYLSQLQMRSSIDEQASEAELLTRIDAIFEQLQRPISETAEVAQLEQQLLQAKTDFTLAWSLLELQDYSFSEQRGRLQTQFAETSIDFALRLAWVMVAVKQPSVTKIVQQTGGRVPGLFLFGMGKLGGYDLNFSSDVDLIGYFDPQVLPVPDGVGKSYVCHQVLQRATQLLGQGGASNFVWRVDWRLRPNASATTLAMSTIAAEDYYYYRASPWHRLALMKARVVAGDMALGEQFLASLSSFIWRQNLDYRALDELAEIKQRINLEHPSLRAQRQWPEPISDDVSGFNVKLGSGGIREIEFIANALQLIWGGRIDSLRNPHTVTALQELAKHKHLNPQVAEQLCRAYKILRKVENALQMLGNQQTHILPTSAQQQRKLLEILAIDSWSDLVKLINPERELAHQAFEELFAEQASAQGEAPVWPDGLSGQADEIVQAWEDGYQIYGVSNQVRHRLLPLTQGLASYLSDTAEDPNDVVARVHDFFRALPAGEQYFRLLAESPELLRRFIPPLLYSPAMTSLLKQSPHIIDCYVRAEWKYPEPFDSGYVRKAENYEQRLERLRRFVNEHLYQLYLEFLQGRMSVPKFQAALTDLAEHTLALALKIVAEHMRLPEVPLSVIGMGKIALRKMSPMSDLDLIFVFDPDTVALELALKYVNRLQTAISTPMREGMVYELDTRLRPSGKSGAPTVSIDSFCQHHLQRAHTWEHIALMSSNVIAGKPLEESPLANIKQQLLSQQRDPIQFLKDSLKMWNRIETHRVSQTSPELMHSKLRQGGLMQAEYLAACMILQNGTKLDLSSVEFHDLAAQVVRNSQIEDLLEIIEFWRIQQLWERLLGMTDQPLRKLSGSYLERLLKHSGCDSLDDLIAKKVDYAKRVDSAMQAFFAPVPLSQAEIDAWQETNVQWL